MPKIRHLPPRSPRHSCSAPCLRCQGRVDPAAYPELASDALLPPILAELKRTLKDPYSIRDFTLCPARAVKLKDGKPVGWAVMLSFNAKNSYGGYEGVKVYSVLFRNGRISGGLNAPSLAPAPGSPA